MSDASTPRSRWMDRFAVAVTGLLGVAHVWAILIACGGRDGLTSPWPIPTHDHPLQFHSSTLATHFFRQSGTNAGYDPSFMAGYPKSILYPPSSTMFDVAALLTGGRWPAQTYKWVVFLAVASFPFLIQAAARAFGLSPIVALASVFLSLVYLWTNGGEAGFPLNYAMYGMVPYLLGVPLGLLWLGVLTRYLRIGGALLWLGTLALGALSWMVHITIPFVVAPGAAWAYLSACRARMEDGRPLLTRGRHLGVWLMPSLILVLNAFWWWPAAMLWSERGDSGFALANPEPVLGRLADIAWKAPPIQAVVYALAVPGWWSLAKRRPIAASAIGGMLLAGFFWGYLAGIRRELDFLQPGRHTYALHLAAVLFAGVGLDVLRSRVPGQSRLMTMTVTLALGLLAVRLFGPSVAESLAYRLGQRGHAPYLSSRPPARLLWIIDRVKQSMRPGERLLYEEAGFDVPGEVDPYEGGRFSGLLPWFTGVELLGGPYMHAAVRANYTQFGEGKLFGKADWTETDFREHAELYRPSAILCWTRHAVAFCESHPELIEIVARDERPMAVIDPRTGQPIPYTSRLVFGRVKGYEGTTSKGEADVAAAPGRLTVSRPPGAELDAQAVLRYHYVPGLTGRPPVALEPVRLGGDPVPFIGLRPPEGAVTLELSFRPGGGAGGPPRGDPNAP